MSLKTFTYTPPGQIDGEPDEVVAVATKQLGALASVVCELSKDTFTQLRAAGVGDRTLEEWENTAEGVKADELRWAANVFAEAVNAISAEKT
jgi:hypothetical protein